MTLTQPSPTGSTVDPALPLGVDGCDGTDEAVLELLAGARPAPPVTGSFLITEAGPDDVDAYRTLRHRHFVQRQGLFDHTDIDDVDAHPNTVVLVARQPGHPDHPVRGGVRLHPEGEADDGHWVGSRLITASDAPAGVGSALVRAACSRAVAEGALRFDATIQADKEPFFARLGWRTVAPVDLNGMAHLRMQWPTGRLSAAADHKSQIGRLVGDLLPDDGWRGDDGAPVPDSHLVAVADSILPAMVERDPWWAGWCAVLVNVNDLTAMGATPVGLLDHLAAPTESLASRVLAGMRAAAEAWDVPVLGGHTQIGVHASLGITMLGCAPAPLCGGGARPGERVSLVADLAGGWRPGYTGRQWDSTSVRSPGELRRLQRALVGPGVTAAKDVSMAGLVGTAAMLAEAADLDVELEVAAIPRPAGTRLADWLTCFPGFALLVTHRDPLEPDRLLGPAGLDHRVVVAEIGRTLARTAGRPGQSPDGPPGGVSLRWPDGYREPVIGPAVTGLGPATDPARPDPREVRP